MIVLLALTKGRFGDEFSPVSIILKQFKEEMIAQDSFELLLSVNVCECGETFLLGLFEKGLCEDYA